MQKLIYIYISFAFRGDAIHILGHIPRVMRRKLFRIGESFRLDTQVEAGCSDGHNGLGTFIYSAYGQHSEN